jgi:hypothetical protein
MAILRSAAAAVLALAALVHTLPDASAASARRPDSVRSGVVHASGRVFADDDGAFLALGTTVFWALWGFEHDRERLGRNLDAVRRAGFDYIRVLGAVGPDGWTDRAVDPNDPGWDERVSQLTDWAYDTYGLRTQWTIFGGVGTVQTPGKRLQVVDRMAAALKGRHEKVFAVEIANEGWQNGFSGVEGRRELKRLAERLRGSYPGLLATTAPPSTSCGQQTAYYDDSPSTFMTLHFARGRGDDRRAAVAEPWDATRTRCPGVPSAISSNEPIGPYSSVREERDPLRLTLSAATSWLAGVGAYVLHTGAGIRGGGSEDLERGRPANLWEVEEWRRTSEGLQCLRATLPADLAGWTRRDGGRGRPFHDVGPAARNSGSAQRRSDALLLTATRGRRFVTMLLNGTDGTALRARRTLSYKAVDPLTCATLAQGELGRGESLTVPTKAGGALVLGEWR